ILAVATVAKTVGESRVGHAPEAKRVSGSPTLLQAWLRRILEVATVAKTVGATRVGHAPEAKWVSGSPTLLQAWLRPCGPRQLLARRFGWEVEPDYFVELLRCCDVGYMGSKGP